MFVCMVVERDGEGEEEGEGLISWGDGGQEGGVGQRVEEVQYLAPRRASCWPGCRCPGSDPDWGSRTPLLDCPRPRPYTLSSWQSWTERQKRRGIKRRRGKYRNLIFYSMKKKRRTF